MASKIITDILSKGRAINTELSSKIKLESNSAQFVLFNGFIISIIGGTISGSHSGAFANGIENDLFSVITLQYFVVK